MITGERVASSWPGPRETPLSLTWEGFRGWKPRIRPGRLHPGFLPQLCREVRVRCEVAWRDWKGLS